MRRRINRGRRRTQSHSSRPCQRTIRSQYHRRRVHLLLISHRSQLGSPLQSQRSAQLAAVAPPSAACPRAASLLSTQPIALNSSGSSAFCILPSAHTDATLAFGSPPLPIRYTFVLRSPPSCPALLLPVDVTSLTAAVQHAQESRIHVSCSWLCRQSLVRFTIVPPRIV